MVRLIEDHYGASETIPAGTVVSRTPLKEQRMVESGRATYFQDWERPLMIRHIWQTYGSPECEYWVNRFLDQEMVVCDDEEWEALKDWINEPTEELLSLWCKYITETYTFKPRGRSNGESNSDSISGGEQLSTESPT